ncbi:hypothetical protein CKA32_005223 [Geitlerinema sp. FC II]|nr:hypothetical protein CKA32_005223 [Geitlerinema sp. FC II]
MAHNSTIGPRETLFDRSPCQGKGKRATDLAIGSARTGGS